MPRRRTIIAPGEYYHLYNRGVNREPVFFGRDNYLFFLKRLRRFLFDEQQVADPSVCGSVTRPVEVVAYCLMPNHYHLLVHLNGDDLSDRMQSLSQAYTNAINRARGRVGPLFQGRFESRHVERDEYFLHLSRYIHLNPVVAGLVSRAEDWEFSSYRDYSNWRAGDLPSREAVLRSFESGDAYCRFVNGGTPVLPGVCTRLAIDDD
ncbi:transposase [Caulifigura coniformis]